MTLKLRMDLSVVFCGKSFQIDWKATFRSEIFYGMTGTSGKDQAQHPRHGSLGKLSPVKLGAICAYWWTRDNHGMCGGAIWLKDEASRKQCYSLWQDLYANEVQPILFTMKQ